MNYYNEDFRETVTVGGFNPAGNKGYKDSLVSTLESLQSTFSISPINEIGSILRHSNRADQYNRSLMEGYTSNIPSDPYFEAHATKMEQLMLNSNYEILKESAIANLAPIVGLTGPVLVKSYTESVSKDIVMTEVSTQPIVKKSFQRKFVKDKAGKKHYVPEIFYNDKWKTIAESGRGKAIPDTWYPNGSDLQTTKIFNFNLLGEAGGSIDKRDTFSYDLHIKKVKMMLNDSGGSPVETEVEVNIVAKIEDDHTTYQKVVGIGADSAKTRVEDDLIFHVDWYHGTVSVNSMNGKIKQVQFGGHLSNQNNTEIIECDREQTNFSWNMEEGVRINTGVTIEKIQDLRAIANLDFTAEMVSDMSQMITAFEDVDILSQLKGELTKWLGNKGEFPLGYEDGFVAQMKFNCKPQSSALHTTKDYLESEFQYSVTTFINDLKNKLKETDLLFVMHGHPKSISLATAGVDWILTPDTQISGLQLNYRFGIKTNNGTRIHVVSTLLEKEDDGITLTAYPINDNIFTFKEWKYSMNIENIYRNPLTPNTPNLMATSRYKFASLLPVQGQILLKDNGYGVGSVPL